MNALPASVRVRLRVPPCLLTVALPTRFRSALQTCLRSDTEVLDAPTTSDAESALRQRLDVCLVFVLPASQNGSDIADLLRLRTQFPDVTAIGICMRGVSCMTTVLRMGGAALTETVLASPTVDMQTLQSALDRCAARTVAQRVWSQARLQLPDALAQLLRAALMLAHAPLTVPRLANACGWHERTLRKQCDRQRLPAPQWIIGWARLLIAAYYLDEPGHSMESVADLLQFPSLAAFRNQLRRYTGLSPSEIRGSGAIQTLRLALERETVGDAIASMDRDAA